MKLKFSEIYIHDPQTKFSECNMSNFSKCRNKLKKYSVNGKLMCINIPNKVIILKPMTNFIKKYFEVLNSNVFNVIDKFECDEKIFYIVDQTVYSSLFPVHSTKFENNFLIFYDFIGEPVYKLHVVSLFDYRMIDMIEGVKVKDNTLIVVIKIHSNESEVRIPVLVLLLEIIKKYGYSDIEDCKNKKIMTDKYVQFSKVLLEMFDDVSNNNTLRDSDNSLITDKKLEEVYDTINSIVKEFCKTLSEMLEFNKVFDLMNYPIRELNKRISSVVNKTTNDILIKYGNLQFNREQYEFLVKFIKKSIIRVLVNEIVNDTQNPKVVLNNEELYIIFNVSECKPLTKSILQNLNGISLNKYNGDIRKILNRIIINTLETI